jgi:Recombination endonuclease VII
MPKRKPRLRIPKVCKRGHAQTSENLNSRNECKACCIIRTQEFNRLNPTFYHDNYIKKTYGLTPKEHEAKKIAQNNRCAICSRLLDAPHTDHNHETQKVRGLLCVNCNTGLGRFMDDPLILEAAAKYLRDWKTLHEQS